MADQTLAQAAALMEPETKVAHGAVERVVPGETRGTVYLEHIGRYEFASRFVKGKAVLDAACGAGYGAQILWAAEPRSYTGIDISAEAIEIARTRYRCSPSVNFALGDVCGLAGVEDRSVDVVVSFETVEHLADPHMFLASLRRVMRPNGTLIISSPNRSYFDPSGTLASKPRNPYHVREWDTSEFVNLLGGFFVVEQVLGQSPYPRWKVAVRRLIRRYPAAACVGGAYRTLNRLRNRSNPPAPSDRAAVPVRQLGRWHCGTYVVCLCRKPWHAQEGVI